MKKSDFVLNVPDNTLFADMPPDLQATINALNSEWPSFPMNGTKPANSRKLIYCRMDKVTKWQLEQMIAAYALDWAVLMSRPLDTDAIEFIAPKTDFMPFIGDVYTTDGETVTSRPATLADPFYVASYAGTEPLLIE